MENEPSSNRLRLPRALVIGLVGVLVLVGLILIFRLASLPASSTPTTSIDALANSNDPCVACHRNASPGVIQEFGHSTMAAAKVTCENCHEVAANYPGATAHEGTYILASPTSAMCQQCHQAEVAQFNQSRHSIPAWVAVYGSSNLSPALISMYQAIPESQFSASKAQNSVAAQESAAILQFACEECHSIGKPAADGSVGECQKCHLRHEFSLEQARKPETCNSCHIGPDHPQFEIYQESPHGVMYATSGSTFNWSAAAGTLTVKDFPAPTCATCHMSGFGGTSTTHDVGERLSWFLFAPISERRPAYQDNIVRMQTVCLECHNKDFVDSFYANADKEVVAVNDLVTQAQALTKPLYDQNILSNVPFDDPMKYTEFELWHHYGRTAKFGAWMQGPDYTQWHGVYEIDKSLAELKDLVQQKMKAAGK